MSKRDVETDYIIPEPYAEEGTIWGGTFKLRNVIEGVIGAGLFVVLVLMLPLSFRATILLATILGLPILVLGTAGLNNGPLSEFLVDAFRYVKNPKVYEYKTLVAPEVDDEPEKTKAPKQKKSKGKPKKSKDNLKKSKDSQPEPDAEVEGDSRPEPEAKEESQIPDGFFNEELIPEKDANKQDKIRMLELELEILKQKFENEERG